MDSKLYRALTAMLWLTLPLTGLQYWSVWDQLPARMATHFGASGQPNGWMTRDTSLIFAMAVTAFVLVALTWALTRVRKPDVLAWSLLAMFFVVMGALFSINVAVLNYNLYGRPLNLVPALAVVFLAAFALTVIALLTKRGAELPRHADVVEAEEVHARPLWALVFAILTAVELGVIAVIPLAACAGHGLAGIASAGSGSAGLERFSLSLYRTRSRDQHSRLSPALHSAAKHQGLCCCALESPGRLRHSRHWRTARLRLGQHRRSHHAFRRRSVPRSS